MFFCVLAFFCEPPFTSTKTIDKPLMSMVSHKPSIQWQWFICKKTLEKSLKPMFEIWKPLKNHWHQWFKCKKTINYNGFFSKNHYHSIVVKILPAFRSRGRNDQVSWGRMSLRIQWISAARGEKKGRFPFVTLKINWIGTDQPRWSFNTKDHVFDKFISFKTFWFGQIVVGILNL